jgi:hypothetical protein
MQGYRSWGWEEGMEGNTTSAKGLHPLLKQLK